MEGLLDDDDFSDLYADVEVQATFAINSVGLCSEPVQLAIKSDGEGSGSNADKAIPSLEGGNLSSDSIPANNVVGEVSEKSEAEEGSESEDDGLTIILNDEDCLGVPIPHASTRTGDGEYEEVHLGPVGSGHGFDKGGLDTDGNEIARGDGVQMSYSLQHRQYKEKRFYQPVFLNDNESASVSSHFLKSTKGDLDNRFMQHRAANTDQVTDDYAMANSVAYHGGYGYSLPWYRTIFDVNLDLFEEKRWRYHGANMSDFFNFGLDEDSWRQYSISVLKGRAIEVEDSEGERLPTMDQSCLNNWESDVVIEIKVQDFEENSSVFGKVDLSDKGNEDKDSRSRELNTNDGGDDCHSIEPNEDQLSMVAAEGNIRSSHSTLKTSKFSRNHDDCERIPISDSDEHDPRRNQAKVVELTEPTRGERGSKKVVERNGSKSYHDNCEKDKISDRDEYHHCRNPDITVEVTEPVGSERDSKNEFQRNVNKSDQHQSNSSSLLDDKSHLSLTLSCSESEFEPSGDSNGVSRCSSLGSELRDPVTSGHNSCKSNDTRQTDSGQNCITDNRLFEGRRSEERYKRVCEHKCQDEHNDQSTKRRHIGGGRHIKCQHDLDFYKRKDSYYLRERDFSIGDGSQRRAHSHVEADYGKHTQNTCHQSCRSEADIWEENDHHYSSLQNRSYRYPHNMDVDRNYSGRELSPHVIVSPMFPRKHSTYIERQIQLGRKSEKLQFGKISHDGFVSDYVMDLPKHRCDSLNEKYLSHGPTFERQINTCERELTHGGNAMRRDHPWHEEEEEEEEEEMLRKHWNDYHQDLINQYPHFKSHARSYASNLSRWQDSKIPTTYDKHCSRVMEKYSRSWEGAYDDDGTHGSGLAGSYDHYTNREDYYINFDEQRKYLRRSRRDQAEQLIGSPGGHRMYADTASCYRDNKNARYKYNESRMTTADMLLEEHGYETIREEFRDNSDKSNPMYRCEREKVRRHINDPVDIVFGEVKPSGKQYTRGSLPSKSQTHRIASLSGKANRRRNNMETKVTEDARKFPATEHDNESDFEEGEIITEEHMIQEKKKCVRETTVGRSSTKTKSVQSVIATPDTAADKVYDEQWLQDRLLKMEKRRERFKDAIPVPEKVTDHITASQPQVDTTDIKKERSARKRRWDGF